MMGISCIGTWLISARLIERSNAFLWEGYCNTFRFSLIKRVFYDEAMAKGVGRNIPIKKLKTFIPEPGTFGEKAAQLVCGKKDKNK